MASQSESNKHIVENDFSPPESVFVCLPLPLATVISGCTYPNQTKYVLEGWAAHMDFKLFVGMVDCKVSSKLSFAKEICECDAGSPSDIFFKPMPPFIPHPQ